MTPRLSVHRSLTVLTAVAALGGTTVSARTTALSQLTSTGHAQGTIATVAGGGVGDGRRATEGVLLGPGRMTTTPSGDLLICDWNRVRLVHDGVITTLAGTGDPGSAGDGGPAAGAQLDEPEGVAVAPNGTVYISDSWNGRIRAVDTRGVITTFAGGLQQPQGLAVDRSGNVYVAERQLHRVVRFGPSGGTPAPVAGTGVSGYDGDGIPAVAAELSSPSDVALDSGGNLYIADTGNNRVRRVDGGGVITSVLPRPGAVPAYTSADTSAVSGPDTLALDHSGRLYVNDAGNGRVLLVDPGGQVSTALQATGISGIAVTPSGRLDAAADGRVFQGPAVNLQGTANMAPVAGEGKPLDDGASGGAAIGAYLAPAPIAANDAQSSYWYDVVTSGGASGGLSVEGSGTLIVPTQTRVGQVSPSGVLSTLAGSGDSPTSFTAVTSDVVGDPSRLDPEGLPATAVIMAPLSSAVDSRGTVYVGDALTHRVFAVDRQGIVHDAVGRALQGVLPASGDNGLAREATLDLPQALLSAPSGDLYIADPGSSSVRRVHNGIITTVAGNPADGSNRLNCTADGTSGNNLYRASAVTPQDGGAATDACLGNPTGLALDTSGALYIADPSANRVRRVDAHGTITTVAGTGIPGYGGDGGSATSAELTWPSGVAVDAAGNLFIADTGNQVIREVDHATGTISTVVGNFDSAMQADQQGKTQWSSAAASASPQPAPPRGDGGPATSAYLQEPGSLAVDPRGNLFITDTDTTGLRVREVYGIAAAAAHAAWPASMPGVADPFSCSAGIDRCAEDAHVLAPHGAWPGAPAQQPRGCTP